MTLLLIVAAVVFTIVAAYHLVSPFLSSREELLRFEVLDDDLRRVEELAARKSTLLQTLRDVEFDFETDKISEQDYRVLKRRYEREAVEVMRSLDDLHGGRGWEETIDAELSGRLEQLAADRNEAEAGGETHAAHTAKEVIACPDCSKEMDADARFCSQCGATLRQDAPADEETSHPADQRTAPDEEQVSVQSRALPASGSEVAT